MGENTQRKEKVYLSFHKNFVRENIAYTDRRTGQQRTFNQVTLPSGTVIDGRDVGGYEFSPLYVNASKFRGPDWRDVPLLAEKEVWLQKSVLDPEGHPVLDESGRRMKDTVKVMPQQIKDALSESRRRWAEEHSADRGLDERAAYARQTSDTMRHDRPARQQRPRYAR
ncbi:hypothetical protein V3M53_01520 [Trueperella pyogenes]|uniref:hypothetical protein n=1 Tax=Trueperella pyogenes TaxID=1661 RepID=UPI00345CC002